MNTYSIYLKDSTRIDVKASNIKGAYKKLCDIGTFAYDITQQFLIYGKDGIDKTGWISTEESIKAYEKYRKVAGEVITPNALNKEEAEDLARKQRDQQYGDD